MLLKWYICQDNVIAASTRLSDILPVVRAAGGCTCQIIIVVTIIYGPYCTGGCVLIHWSRIGRALSLALLLASRLASRIRLIRTI